MQKKEFSFYGIRVSVTGDGKIAERLSRDFSFFLKDSGAEADIKVTVKLDVPDPAGIKHAGLSHTFGDIRVFDEGQVRRIDYSGEALSVYDYASDSCTITSHNSDLLHELAYLVVLSRLGEFLDLRGIHRMHAAGFELGGQGFACLMPQAGGKTTLLLELMKNEKVKLLSDDTCLLDGSMRIVPFPLRIGVNPAARVEVPERFLGYMVRRKYGPKKLIDVAFFKDRISSGNKLRAVFIGKRVPAGACRISKIGKLQTFLYLTRDCVIGAGIAQMREYFIRFNARDVLKKAFILFSRVKTCLKAAACVPAFEVRLGPDSSGNANALIAFLKSRFFE
ncbi:MAG: hypothetical protein JW803_02160 [Endomicrobiales bacterium]|nr:hypothetical protein [Endomicrobiales bacterium]